MLFGLLVALVLLGNFAECDTPEAADAQVPATLMDELPPIADDRKGTGPNDEQASLIHPRLSELLGTVMPHEFDKIFMDKKLPLESLLALPVASIPCAEATKAYKESTPLQVKVLDLPNNMGRIRQVKAEVLDATGHASTAKLLLLMRGLRVSRKAISKCFRA